MKEVLLKIAIILFFVMFIYSGISKIKHFNQKTATLSKKTGFNHIVCNIGMFLVILLEIIGSLYLILYFMFSNSKKNIYHTLAVIITLLFCAFMVVVTFIYHPPNDKLIPFLSNVTTFAGFLLILYLLQ